VNLKGKEKKAQEFFRTEHVFDFIVFSYLFGIVFSRLLYIILNYDLFQDARWFWIPYERIEGDVFLFQSFPWLFFKMDLETVVIDGFAIGFFWGLGFVRSMHKLEWKKISMALCDYVGLLIAFGSWLGYIYTKLEFLVYPVLILLGLWLTKELTKSSFEPFKKLTAFLWKFFSISAAPLIITYNYLRSGLCCMLSSQTFLISAISLIWIYFIINIFFGKKKKVEVQKARPGRKWVPGSVKERKFSLSYRTLTGSWWNKLTSTFKSKDEKSQDKK